MEMDDDAVLSSASSSDVESEDSEDSLLTPGISPPAELEDADVSPSREDGSDRDGETQDATVIHARAYQLEMFEESLKRNIIVAMDTGTGKTQVAVLRIKAELDRSPPEKLVWFIAPTVALCVQQFESFKTQIRSVQMKLMSGADNCDTWSEPRIWDEFLRNVRIVVSTPQVLYDAVSHAFVRFSRLALLIFDEAHRCAGKSPGGQIMARYHGDKNEGRPVPAILGLTATPIANSKLEDLEVIEKTLDAVCRSPNVHRAQLMSVVKRPEMSYVLHAPPDPSIAYTKSMESLLKTARELDIFSDPEIIRLRRDNTERSIEMLKRAIRKESTKITRQMQSLCRKSIEVWHEVGGWAADYFIYTSISQFLASVTKNDLWFETWGNAEKQYLAGILQKVEVVVVGTPVRGTPRISDKVNILVRELLSSPEGSTGIIFARQTATVAVLAQILSILPSTRSRFQTGSMLGTSQSQARKRKVGEFYRENEYDDLIAFQDGKLNLLVATDVLEEGIDVPACNLVVCFDPPGNLRSFIQRRGRARAQESRLVTILPEEGDQHMEWVELEMEMKKKYEDESREIQQLVVLENEENPDVAPLRIPATGAQLDFDQAKSHLEHVCTSLTAKQYVESRPYYLIRETRVALNSPPIIKATVVLPVSFPPHLRRFEGSQSWYSEKKATKDAAFQAFVALYKAGLVNDYLMPLGQEVGGLKMRQAKVSASELWNPWIRVAGLWNTATRVNTRRLSIVDQHGQVISEFDASFPGTFPDILAFNVSWDKTNTWRIEVGELRTTMKSDLKLDQSMALVDLAYGHRWEVYNLPHILHLQSSQNLPFREAVGQQAIEETTLGGPFLTRDADRYPYFYQSSLPCRPSLDLVKTKLKNYMLEEPVEVPWLALKQWPRRRDFLHPVNDTVSTTPSTKPYHIIRPASQCRVDGVPVSVIKFGALVPAIMHTIEVHLIADELRKTILKESTISNLPLVVTAISSSAAHESTNYERLEFLGDSILKLLTSANVAANHPYYPEGYLSRKKDQVISNSRLYHSTLDTGLDKFILTKSFTGKKWRPVYIDDMAKLDPEVLGERNCSTKTLADVVESLIGASFVDGGMDKALSCIRIFVPEVEWHTLDVALDMLAAQKPKKSELPSTLVPLEGLLGYTFQNKTLAAEAMTHSSFNVGPLTETCMERLEFIGDAVLDNIVVAALWNCEREYSPYEMSILRAASVNGDLLGFLMMEWTFAQEITSVLGSGAATVVESTTTRVPVWRLMRHSSARLGGAQGLAEERHAAGRAAVLAAMVGDADYPWALLARLQIPKSFSDLFEALLGAVWVDSGSLDACAAVAERAGVLPYLRRLLADGVEVAHPKKKLGELASRRQMDVVYETELRRARDGGGCKEWICTVLVGGEPLVEVDGGVAKEEVMTKAADVAYRLLKHGEGMAGQGEVVMT